ncbi:DUF4406 domain-containing protein [Desulfosporosinus sp. Sb-LF]|uniref:DUF7768 domain-containing protein n=1 Tax=Desulfosporosinus sp. Sb-LF TaxID=2560027 RepID=UPI00107F645E|nr:DUF4406 domain-containing protein [Desulfosporosinus sp. Sb-LF]TGE31306.1 DUF4406 domain-containing protein [Desulfosporosinus sp. Sb-LF]
MKYVYICSPYRGDVDYNIATAQFYCQFATSQGVIPMAPHIYFTQFLDDNEPNERTLGLIMGQDILKHCSELWVFGNRISEGMRNEIESAERLEIPILFYSNRCKKRGE